MRRFVNTTIVVFRSFVLIFTNALTGWVHIFNLCSNTVERDSQLTSESCGKIKFRKAIGLRGLEKVLPKSLERLFRKKKGCLDGGQTFMIYDVNAEMQRGL